MEPKLDPTSVRPVQVFMVDGMNLGVAPLSAEERIRADEMAQRLSLELRGLLDLLPDDQRGATAMSRTLDIDRNTCQRIVAATARSETAALTLVQLPGVAGLRQFVDAMSKLAPEGEADQSIAAVRAATDRFEGLIAELGGSQRKLRERLEMDREVAGADAPVTTDNLSTRRSLFRAAAEIMGRWSETRLTMRIIRPVPGDPLHTEDVRMTAHVGHMSRPGAVPLEVFSGTPDQLMASTGPAFQSLDASQSVGDTPRYLMQSFCTRSLPRVTSRAAGGRMSHTIDEAATPGRPSDIFVADRRAGRDKHPATQHPAIGEVSTIMNLPARRFVMDVYLHREIAGRCIPSLEVHLSAPGQLLLSRWNTRLPGGPRLQLLGMGIEQAHTDAYPRQVEVQREMFTGVGWDPSEFVGYRCDVAYPIWRAAYCMLFDFAGAEDPEASAQSLLEPAADRR